jgi:hypothetical protein
MNKWIPLSITIIWLMLSVYKIITQGIEMAFPLGFGGGLAVSLLWLFW